MEALRRDFKRLADVIEKSMDDFKGETDFKKKQGMNSMKNKERKAHDIFL